MNRKRARQLNTVLIVIGFVIALPVIVPYALIANALTDRRRQRDADNFSCVQCGKILGHASIAKANEYWREHVGELHKRFPGARLRLVRDVWAICDVCGARYNYRTKDKAFKLHSCENDGSFASCHD